MRISDWSSDVCSSDLGRGLLSRTRAQGWATRWRQRRRRKPSWRRRGTGLKPPSAAPIREDGSCSVANAPAISRSEEHTSELQSLMRISYAVFCLKKKTTKQLNNRKDHKKHTMRTTTRQQHRQKDTNR